MCVCVTGSMQWIHSPFQENVCKLVSKINLGVYWWKTDWGISHVPVKFQITYYKGIKYANPIEISNPSGVQASSRMNIIARHPFCCPQSVNSIGGQKNIAKILLVSH